MLIVELVFGRAWAGELSDQDLDQRADEAGRGVDGWVR